MRLFSPSSAALQFAMVLACTAACADEAQKAAGAAVAPDTQAIVVTATRDPVGKSYRKMLRGMDLFEKRRGLAPNASLRYKLLPRQSGARMDGIEVQVVGDSFEIPVALAPDRTFTLERNQLALDEGASVTLNRKASSMTWRTEIRTPGLPPDTRRLGDLRLECHVGMEADLVSNMRPVVGQIRNFIDKMVDYCDATVPHYYFFAPRPLFSVTMVAGARREILSVDELYAGTSEDPLSQSDLSYCDCQVLLDRTFYMPLGDKTWPDDTLIEFEYMDDDDAKAVAR
jgi:hypothetical protein